MLHAAKALALTALDFLRDENLRQAAWKEFKEKLGGYTYTSGIPPDKKPPVRKKSRHVRSRSRRTGNSFDCGIL